MKTKRTSIDTIAEVLVDELGKMEANTKQIQKESLRMQQIASKPIEVNTEPIRAILKRFETLSTQKSLVPVWSYVVTVVSVVLLCAACLVAYLQYQDKEQAQGRVETFSQYIRESDQVERFNQWLDSPEQYEPKDVKEKKKPWWMSERKWKKISQDKIDLPAASEGEKISSSYYPDGYKKLPKKDS